MEARRAPGEPADIRARNRSVCLGTEPNLSTVLDLKARVAIS